LLFILRSCNGYHDILISAVYANKVYLLKGKRLSTNLTQTADIEEYLKKGEGGANGMAFTMRRDPSIVNFGVALSSIKDFNGDGYDDIVISAFGVVGSGLIFIVCGRTSFFSPSVSTVFVNDPSVSGIITIVAPTYSFAGLSLSGTGDVNGDGFGDLLIGSIPYNKGYSSQQSFLVYGSRSSSRLLFLANITAEGGGGGSLIKGGGFLVNGIGDINNDGYDDMMITDYKEWQGKIGSYLVVYPSKLQWISSIPSFLPTSDPTSHATSSPTSSPSKEVVLYPSDIPSVSPSLEKSLFPSSSPSFSKNFTSRSPSFLTTLKPTKNPTLCPSKLPSLIPTRKPTVIPSLAPSSTSMPSLVPTLPPSTLSPTKRPSLRPSHTRYPSSSPTSQPSLTVSSQGRTVMISSGGSFQGGNGEEKLVISASQDVIIQGNQGKKHFIFSSVMNNITITIIDFKSSSNDNEEEAGDVLDFSLFLAASSASSASFVYSYSTNPVTFHISSPVLLRIILSSHQDYDLSQENMILPSSLSSSSSSSAGVSLSSSPFQAITSFLSVQVISVIAIFLGLLVAIAYYMNYQRKRTMNLHDEVKEKNRKREYVGSEEDPELLISASAITVSSVTKPLHRNQRLRDSVYDDKVSISMNEDSSLGESLFDDDAQFTDELEDVDDYDIFEDDDRDGLFEENDEDDEAYLDSIINGVRYDAEQGSNRAEHPDDGVDFVDYDERSNDYPDEKNSESVADSAFYQLDNDGQQSAPYVESLPFSHQMKESSQIDYIDFHPDDLSSPVFGISTFANATYGGGDVNSGVVSSWNDPSHFIPSADGNHSYLSSYATTAVDPVYEENDNNI
jgi:hypothetical protein